jgi:nicotinic acid mononucleotide adenylyltransferase
LKLLGGRLIVLHREGDSSNLEERVAEVSYTESAEVVLLDVPSLEKVSSSLVRSCGDEEKLREMLSMGVFEYLKRNRLYAFMEGAGS